MSRPNQNTPKRILGIDTDVLVHWAMAGAPHHQAVRSCLEREVQGGRRLALAQQTLHEFLHIVTDPRRFEQPLSTVTALRLSHELWHSRDVERILPTLEVLDMVCELMEGFNLGRKRILDTALAATVQSS